jgi:uncharacterized protein YkwD
VVLGLPAVAEARAPCPAEQVAATAATGPQVADAVFCLTNPVRAHFGLLALRRDARLDQAARLHSQDMALRGYFAHTTPEGLDPSDRTRAQGYPSGAGENIAYGYPTARAVVLGWMASAGHCRNMVGAARDLGVGLGGSAPAYVTQDFGDYFSQSVPEAPAAGCPYALDLDALNVPGDAAAVPGTDGVTATPPTVEVGAAPVLGRLSLSPARLRAGGRGTTVAFTLSAPATVRLDVERVRAGRASRRLSGALTRVARRGANRVRFSGRLGGRRLAPGRYRLRAVATDRAGRRSTLRRVAFRVAGR